ncbi:unnamed protein product [Rodentolepis nana]|uniref:H15 domain-containing protein n=1 Tax=Rodentolepis nana TaxID=102285 RepID=A0A0R3TMZ5_RODNA|nr:unnamed protein product [Rodentolepis nana]
MMVAAATAPAGTSSASKAKKTKAPASHPPFAKMIVEAIAALKERGGSSRQAILKYVKSHYKIDDKVAEVNVRKVLVSAAASGKIVRVKGTGASGSFKLAAKGEKSDSEKPKKTVKPKAEKAAKKSATPKKSKSGLKPKKVAPAPKPKKSPAKKAEKKSTVAKTPKTVKVKKPATKKTPTKRAAPKK